MKNLTTDSPLPPHDGDAGVTAPDAATPTGVVVALATLWNNITGMRFNVYRTRLFDTIGRAYALGETPTMDDGAVTVLFPAYAGGECTLVVACACLSAEGRHTYAASTWTACLAQAEAQLEQWIAEVTAQEQEQR